MRLSGSRTGGLACSGTVRRRAMGSGCRSMASAPWVDVSGVTEDRGRARTGGLLVVSVVLVLVAIAAPVVVLDVVAVLISGNHPEVGLQLLQRAHAFSLAVAPRTVLPSWA